jgi:hypothetical protein
MGRRERAWCRFEHIGPREGDRLQGCRWVLGSTYVKREWNATATDVCANPSAERAETPLIDTFLVGSGLVIKLRCRRSVRKL